MVSIINNSEYQLLSRERPLSDFEIIYLLVNMYITVS